MLVGPERGGSTFLVLKGVMFLIDEYDYLYRIKKDYGERRSNLEKVEMV